MKNKRSLYFYTLMGSLFQFLPAFYSHAIINRFIIMYDMQGRNIPLLIFLSKLVLLCYLIPFLFLFLAIKGIVQKKSDDYFIHLLGAEVLTPITFLFFAVGCLVIFIMNIGLKMS